MDCEKYDRIVLDLLYEELDELTMVAAKRHMEQCARCREVYARFRATREVGVVPLIDPPDGFEQRVLEAERGLRAQLPLGQRLGRAISILAGYSMRPQLAMAALLLLMIGSSLIFLKARPGQRGTVHITERGVPGAEAESLVLPAQKPEPATPPAKDLDNRAERAQANSTEKAGTALRLSEAEKARTDLRRDEIADSTLEQKRKVSPAPKSDLEALGGAAEGTSGGVAATEEPEAKESDATVSLDAARELQQSSGCAVAAPKLDQVAARYPGTPAAYEATWRAAECHRLLGELGRARQGYQSLLAIDRYRSRAQAALDALRKNQEIAASAAPNAAAPPSKPSSEKAAAPSSPSGASAPTP